MRRLGLLFLLLALLAPARVHGFFHMAMIDELMSGVGSDPSVQYVEIRMLTGNQNLVSHTRLTVFHCDGSTPTVLLEVPKNVPNQGTNVRWLMATPAFAAAACLQPDFTFEPGIPSCGQVCWGAPGSLPPNPPNWDPTIPDYYVDCVAYGGYAGPMRTGATPVPLPPGDGIQSLQRGTGGDFVLGDVSPTNNASLVGNFSSPCPSTTTTSSTTLPRPGATTTTTTPAAGVDSTLSGKRLVLKDDANNPGKRSILVLSNDKDIGLGAGNGSADDPTPDAGGAVRVRTAAGCGPDGALPCDTPFTLPGKLWSRLGRGANKGYRLRDPRGGTSPIRLLLLKPGHGRVLRVVGRGAGLAPLAANPGVVDVVVTTGAKHYCLRFDHVTRFKPSRLFIASGAAPAACP